MAHYQLTRAMDKYIKDSGKDKLSYEDAKKHGIDAVQKAGAIQCERKCLEAQLDAHYKCAGKELNALSGAGGAKKGKPPEDASTEILD